jgi:hypothetical protein
MWRPWLDGVGVDDEEEEEGRCRERREETLECMMCGMFEKDSGGE